ncbi:transcriptional regulator [Chitinophaga barathri]|uniref:Transcriptional regulator n=1 Tax=Chitinophaga barathri TaxID=1647451 RepID=A0A3N4MNS0_9BACT|nr:transcriptional regulator [Chitinophaga barathri]RPD41710.1 transcriptional regulator [Chitinophaga barathri]
METFTVDKDIKAFYVTASSFPDGIKDAHEKLHSMVPFSRNRKYLGISRPEGGGGIVYRAAATELEPGEFDKLKLESLVLKKGKYAAVDIHDYMKDLTAIGHTFNEILEREDLDPQGYCVEWYTSDKDVKCMIRLAE